MIKKILHTPEGVRDIYSDECEKKLILEKQLRSVLNSYGYRDIETPTLEYFDVFGTDVGTIPSRDLYKFYDRDGETLVMRPDFTPAIARAASKYFSEDDRPIRLCYTGNTFVNNSNYQGRLRETTQLGAELLGDSSVEADAEIIAMVIDTLKKAGLKDFQISLGHVKFFEALAQEAGLHDEMIEELRELIKNKNTFGVNKCLAEIELTDQLRECFGAIPMLFGGVEVLEKAEKMTEGLKAAKALARLREVLEILKVYEMDQYVSFDLGMLSTYMYYTGIIFRGYTYGTGEAIVKGGRYDLLLKHFGKDAAAIGFVVVINQLMNAMSRQKIEILTQHGRTLILYKKEDRKEAIVKAVDYRRQGQYVELVIVSDDENMNEKMEEWNKGGYAAIIRIGGLA